MMTAYLKGKTAIVTGAAGGIGRAICEKLGSYGMNVVLVGRSADRLREAAASVRAHGGHPVELEGDIKDEVFREELLRKTEEATGSIDVLINCAGQAQHSGFADVNVGEYDAIMDINVKAPYFLSQKALEYLRKSDSATIINIASVVAHKGYVDQSVYAASKHAILGWSKSLANEVYGEDIRVHVVTPGGVYTDMVAFSRPDLSPDGMPVPEDVAEIIGFLLQMRHTNAVIDEIEFHRKNKAPFA